MKVLFVYPNISRQTTPQVGIASLLSVIRRSHEVHLFDLTEVPLGLEMTAYRRALEHSPDIVLFSCRSNEWSLVREMIRETFPIRTIVGGIHATTCPEEVIQYANMLIRGEAENAIDDVLLALSKGKPVEKIANVWVKNKGCITKNDVRNLISNLDRLPSPSWDLIPRIHFERSYIKSLFPWIDTVGTFEASRGCPYSCTYCCNEYIQRLYKGKGKWHRRKSPGRVVKEVSNFKKIYPSCNFLYFVDETFMVDIEWLREFNRLHDKTPFVFMTRPEVVTEEKMKLVADSGGMAASIGVENGNEKFRRDVLNRHMSNRQIIDAFRIAKEYGLNTYSFNMVGMPHESSDDVQSTIDLNKRIRPTKAQFTIFYPFKGTKLYDVCRENGYLSEDIDSMVSYYGKSFLRLPQYEEGEVERWVQKAEKVLN